jgi:hypothetical protein
MTNQQPDSKTTVYCVKYALSRGIFRVKTEGCGYFYEEQGYKIITHYLSLRQWQPNWTEALKAAKKMRERKIASLQKQITKLQSIQFTEPTE